MSQAPYSFRHPAPPPPQGNLRAAPDADVFAKAWHAVYTLPRHEKSLSRHLSLREVEHFVPVYTVRRKWNDGSKVTLELPLFPGYIFVYISRRSRGRVLESPGALHLVNGLGAEPAMIPESQINFLRNATLKDCAQPHPFMVAGQRVRVYRGAFAGLEGILQRIKGRYRVVVSMELLMQSVSVEMEMGDFQLI